MCDSKEQREEVEENVLYVVFVLITFTCCVSCMKSYGKTKEGQRSD